MTNDRVSPKKDLSETRVALHNPKSVHETTVIAQLAMCNIAVSIACAFVQSVNLARAESQDVFLCWNRNVEN